MRALTHGSPAASRCTKLKSITNRCAARGQVEPMLAKVTGKGKRPLFPPSPFSTLFPTGKGKRPLFPRGGKRRLGIPCVLDRVLMQAIAKVLGDEFNPTFSDDSD